MDFHRNDGIPCYFRVKFRNNIKIFDFAWADLSFENFKSKRKYFLAEEDNANQLIYCFTQLVIAEFKIKVDDGSNTILKLTDNTGAKIPINKFVDIVTTFHKGSMFTVNVEYGSPHDASPIINPIVSINNK